MGDNWPVFITAQIAPPKEVNRALLLIQDFEYTEYPTDVNWRLLISKALPSTLPPATIPPISEIVSNDFVRMTLADVNAFVRARENLLTEINLSSRNWLVIDQRGLETSTCLVCDQYYFHPFQWEGEDDVQEGYTAQFRACRIPYDEAWIVTQNLHIGNLYFEDFVDKDAGEMADGSWRWLSFAPSTEEIETKGESEMQREEESRVLREGGYVD
ncbi:hypothetical protein K438DRAFT_1776567 [Mycena galopus ATCC 62051]|nr:hypothetical protein K438DRAFT_1776567 [Mycena galopus ATCC 62051]